MKAMCTFRKQPMNFLKVNRSIPWLCTRAIWLVVYIAGCQRNVEDPTSDAFRVASSISSLSHVGTDSEGMSRLFVEGVLPDSKTLAGLQSYMAKVNSNQITITGDTATAKVTLEVTQTGELLGPKTWTLQRIGDRWKIKEIVLP